MRVFLSYSRRDQEFVEELYRRLKRDGVNCFYDRESIEWGDNWVRALEREIDKSEAIVCVLSPDFCNSEWTQLERTGGFDRKALPLMLRHCAELLPRFLRPIQFVDVSTTELFERNYPRICERLEGVLKTTPTTADRSRLPPKQPLPDRHRMPYHSLNGNFVGRVDPFWRLFDSLHRHSTAVLHGTGIVVGAGGLGKSQLAIEYAHRMGSLYPSGVYWVDAGRGLSSIVAQLGRAARIEVDQRAEEPDQLEQLWQGMNRLGPSLLILDNVPENAPLRAYLPRGGRIHTVVTTRGRQPNYSQVFLDSLSIDEGVRLLNSGERDFGDEAEGLVERLGGLPLALELAKSYLNERRHAGIAELIRDMDTATMDVVAEFSAEYRDQLPSGHEADVIGTFQMSWDVASAPARQVLRVMGELGPFPVPLKFLRAVLEWQEESGRRDQLGKSVDELLRLSLVETTGGGDPVAHRLILAFVRRRNVVDGWAQMEICRDTLRSWMRRALENPGAAVMREIEAMTPHAERLVAAGRLRPEEAADLSHHLGWHHRAMGRYVAARTASSSALRISEAAFEPGHPDIAARQSNLAIVLQDLGQPEEARDLLRKALAADEKTFAPGHPSIAVRQSNLALVLEDLGQLEEARELLRKALASNENAFEPGHPSVARSQSNLALVLRDLGQLEEAQDLLRKALASAEKTFEDGHPSTAIRQSNLAMVLKDLGQLEEAQDLLRKALASAEKTFEAGHPAIAIRQSNLAMMLKDAGQLNEARELLRKAVASSEMTFEPGHPSVAIRLSNLTQVLQDLGQLEEARDLLTASLASFEKALPSSHRNIAIVRSSLERVLERLRR